MTAAAFIDLDRTLVAGASGFYWARAAVDAGLISRRQMAGIIRRNVEFRLRGSTDDTTDEVRAQISRIVAGQRVVDLRRMMPEVLAGVLPRIYPQMLEVAVRVDRNRVPDQAQHRQIGLGVGIAVGGP